VSDNYETYVTPKGYAYFIWIPIYLLLLLFALYQLLPSTYKNDSDRRGLGGDNRGSGDTNHRGMNDGTNRSLGDSTNHGVGESVNRGVGFWLLLNMIANIAWAILWNYEQLVLAVLAILLVTFTAGRIYAILKSDYSPASSAKEYFLVHVPFSLYFAWLIYVTIVNIYAAGTDTTTEAFVGVGVVGLIVLFVILATIAHLAKDWIVSAVGVWALIAVAINFANRSSRIVITASILAALLCITTVIAAIMAALKWRKHRATVR
jgi:hypothetical protein